MAPARERPEVLERSCKGPSAKAHGGCSGTPAPTPPQKPQEASTPGPQPCQVVTDAPGLWSSELTSHAGQAPGSRPVLRVKHKNI